MILAMSTLLAVLLVLVGGINVANYTGIVSEADRILSSDNLGPVGKNTGGKTGIGFGDPLSQDRHNASRFFSLPWPRTGRFWKRKFPPSLW